MIKVMIIEDDPMVRDINSRFLKRIDGFKLYKAVGNLTEAKQFIKSKNLDLILLDVFLPNENGIDFLKWLRSEEIKTDVILITADKTIERVQEAFRYGAVDYLIKPFNFERFKESLVQFKERYYEFKNIEEIEQSKLDKLILNSEVIQKEEGLAKGFNKYTYKSLWDEIEKINGEYFTSEDMSERIKVARVTVRRYLEYMEKEGHLEKIVEYGKVGRPQHKFRKL
ncbi:response regulator [Romboutsia lituseburensis]|uniref:Transcriptional regulatory protein n=1 Tax=Romboutsia lituseburensis DSM 797 TaxID=1121325 RepID=A0A1G9T2B8_9FIRM|nr:response regulator [Romboutsia lituseburensis]CEH36010.1 Transcriptional regulatory protein MalR [Romboutsia lituseburensis]SDM41800.1 two-component system, CitB family, response regulator [Romboutsia lituseburensis DSM 797]